MANSKKEAAKKKNYKNPPASDSDIAAAQEKFCLDITEQFLADEDAYVFSQPVLDMWGMDELPGYFDLIKTPMDFGTVKENISGRNKFINQQSAFFDYTMFMDDVYLIFENCFKYNEADTDIYETAVSLKKLFEKRMKNLPLTKPSPAQDAPSDDDDANSDQETKVGASKPKRRTSASRASSRRTAENSEEDDGDESMEDVENGGRTDDKNSMQEDDGDDDDDDDDEHQNGEDDDDEGKANGVNEDSDDKDSNDDDADESGGNDDDAGETAGNGDEKGKATLASLKEERKRLGKLKEQSETALAELELETNIVEMSEDERKKLRDEIEKAPWETVERIGRVLRSHVKEALAKMPKGEDPEFVTIEMSAIDAKVLREVEKILNPNDRHSEEAKKLKQYEVEIEDINGRIRRAKRRSASASDRAKKRRR